MIVVHSISDVAPRTEPLTENQAIFCTYAEKISPMMKATGAWVAPAPAPLTSVELTHAMIECRKRGISFKMTAYSSDGAEVTLDDQTFTITFGGNHE